MTITFEKLSPNQAFEITEILLGMMFDILYTKGSFLFSESGVCLRTIILLITCLSFAFFGFVHNMDQYSKVDISLTSLLLICTVVLEMYAVCCLLSTDWFFAWLAINDIDYSIPEKLFSTQPFHMPRWSNKLGQYTLLNNAFTEDHRISSSLFCFRRKCRPWDAPVDDQLKSVIFR